MEELIRTVPKSVSFEPKGTTHDLTAEELASMLLGVHDGVYYLAMTIVCGLDHAKTVTDYLYKNKTPKLYQTYRMNDSERARGLKNGFLWHLTHLATSEYIDPCICVYCGGGNGLKTIECPECIEGHLRMDDKQKASYLAIDPKRFNYWLPMYNRIYSILSSWESEARRILKDQSIEI